MTGQMLPPWKMFPYPWGSLGWRMGSGEDYYVKYLQWYRVLPEHEKAEYRRRHPEPWGWRDWYDAIERGPGGPIRGFERSLRENRDFLLWGLAFWPVLFALGFLNGVLREVLISPLTGEEAALPVSGLTLLALLLVAVHAFMREAPRPWNWRRPWRLPWSLPALGLMWAGLTVGAGYLLFVGVMGEPAAAITHSLTPAAVAEGNLFLLVLIGMAIMPAISRALLNAELARNRARYYAEGSES